MLYEIWGLEDFTLELASEGTFFERGKKGGSCKFEMIL